jgi:hypothetical protein
MAEDPFKAMNLSRREYLSKFGQSVIDSPNSNISDREDALVVKEGLSNQRGREAQQQFYDVAPNAREAFLEDNAVISASPQFGQVQGYMGEVRRGPTYADNVLRKSIASRVPAYLRGEYNARVDAGEGVNEVFADLEIKDEDRNLRLKGIEAGIAPADMDKFRNPETGLHDVEAVQYEIAQRKRTPASGTSPQMKAMEDEYEFLRQSVKDMKDEYGGLAPPTGENPEYDAAVLQMRGLGARMSAYRRGVFSPPSEEVATPPAGTAPASVAGAEVVAPTVSVDDPRSLREKLAGEAPMFPAPEVKPPLMPGSTAPQEYVTRIKASATQPERIAAFEQFKKDYEEGKLPTDPNDTMGEALQKRSRARALLDEAQREIEFAPVRDEYNKEWEAAKGMLEADIQNFARTLGVDPRQVINSLAANEKIRVESGETLSEPEPVWSLLERYLKENKRSLSDEVPNLQPFAKSEFADQLGMGFFSSGAKTWGDVLDAYASGAKAPAVEGSPKIKKITILP